jgi:hypothetical protein
VWLIYITYVYKRTLRDVELVKKLKDLHETRKLITRRQELFTSLDTETAQIRAVGFLIALFHLPLGLAIVCRWYS